MATGEEAIQQSVPVQRGLVDDIFYETPGNPNGLQLRGNSQMSGRTASRWLGGDRWKDPKPTASRSFRCRELAHAGAVAAGQRRGWRRAHKETKLTEQANETKASRRAKMISVAVPR